MRVFIATETVMYKAGSDLYVSNSFKSVISRYKRFFGDIILCTRVSETGRDEVPGSYDVVTDIVTEYLAIKSLKAFVKGDMKGEIEGEIAKADLVVARVPSIVAYKAAAIAGKYNKKYMVEVVGCAWDAYWNYSAFGKLVAPIAYFKMKKAVAHADYASYVTEKFLQKRYPCSCPSIHASNVLINECSNEVFEKRKAKIAAGAHREKLVLATCAAVDVAYKGQEYVIKAIPKLNSMGIRVEYRLAGFGSNERLRTIAEAAGVSDQVVFLGALSRAGVFSTVDEADIYIQPSLQEGLPRSVIEAMSRACPALGARTAGIPELIDDECVFTPANPDDTAKKIAYMYNADLSLYAEHNFRKAQEYLAEVLEERRNTYYAKIRSEIEK